MKEVPCTGIMILTAHFAYFSYDFDGYTAIYAYSGIDETLKNAD